MKTRKHGKPTTAYQAFLREMERSGTRRELLDRAVRVAQLTAGSLGLTARDHKGLHTRGATSHKRARRWGAPRTNRITPAGRAFAAYEQKRRADREARRG
jgi:hypothetical protein